MGITIGDGNTFSGITNISDESLHVSHSFNQTFKDKGAVLALLAHELQSRYRETDRDIILAKFTEFREEMLKPSASQDIEKINALSVYAYKAFAFLANSSSIAGLVVTVWDILRKQNFT